MKERVCRFGERGNLVGIVTEPNRSNIDECTPAVILLNAGFIHRVGPFRLNVEIARSVARAGFVAFRFDLSGIGDSETTRDIRSRDERSVADIQAAMDHLLKTEGIVQFVLVGLCTGADQAHRTAVVDSRVSGVVSLDGYGYKTWRYYLYHYGPRLMQLSAWKNFIKHCLWQDRRKKQPESRETSTVAEVHAWQLPDKKHVSKDYISLVQRNVELLYVYSGGVASYYNYRNQLKDSLSSVDFDDKLQIEYYPEADHLYMVVGDRVKLISTIRVWLQSRFLSNNQSLEKSNMNNVSNMDLDHNLASAG